MKLNEINIRDPYILLHDETYYLYGTRSASCWGIADGFDCYSSKDRKNWKGPVEVFHRPKGFFANQNYWAPECYFYKNAFYLITTFGSENLKKGVFVLKASSPTGPFELYSERLTPENWNSIDGTLYFEEESPYLIFSHSFEDTPNGDMCLVQLSRDLKKCVGKPALLFSATETKWARPIPFAKEEFGMEGDVYFTDGPCVIKGNDGVLYMTWSSWGNNGYAVGVALSENGRIKGPWKQLEKPLFQKNGGHGMMLLDLDGDLWFTLHSPNDKYQERPQLIKIEIKNKEIQVN